MTRFALFLRGINVGGVTITMAPLRALLTEIGAGEVRTWLASGNVAMDWAGDDRDLLAAVLPAISERFGHPVRAVVMPFDELAAVASACPFAPDPDHHRYVLLCEAAEVVSSLLSGAPALDPSVEQIAGKGRVIYWRCPKGGSLTTAFATFQGRHAARDRFTVRNLNTVERMLR